MVSKALPVIKQLLPERYQEFKDLYKLDKRNDDIDSVTYTISDYLAGIVVLKGTREVVSPLKVFIKKYEMQMAILASAEDRIDSLLADIEGVFQSELFKNELEAAR